MTGQKKMQWAIYTERIQQLPSVALRFIIKDATKAIAAMPGGINAGYYTDEICICAQELTKRAIRYGYGLREEQYAGVLAQMYLILREAGYNSNEMVDDLCDLINDSRRPATEGDE